MVKSVFDNSIKSGTALSRSRFEDDTFTHGENLKSGVHTAWGTVKIQQHTEFEIRFTDPATNDLHPGVRETIRKGSNLFVTYPGYSDYRHIPVVGKGVTFNLPGSPDTWGMMCEADLEEVYRHRSLNFKLMNIYTACVGSNSQQHGHHAREVASASQTMNKVVRALHTSSDRLKNTATKLHQLAGVFQVTAR